MIPMRSVSPLPSRPGSAAGPRRRVAGLAITVLLAGTGVVLGLWSAGRTEAAAGPIRLEAKLTLLEKGKATRGELQFAVVSFEPEAEVRVQAPAEPFEISMTRKEFVPRVLAVPAGSRVSFPNDDRILHNVFSRSGGNRFDLGFYRRGESKETRFDHAGVAQIFCNVHHSMVAHVVVLETPHYTSPDREGRWLLEDLPAGPGTLVLWHERAEAKRIPVTLPAAGTLSFE
ncbi:MAG: hypothetical protein MI919_20305, partial [Holophagales bacterium]|nr:hypothetical protein [Holophagales bacterium]